MEETTEAGVRAGVRETRYRGMLDSEVFSREAIDELYGRNLPTEIVVDRPTRWRRWATPALVLAFAAGVLALAFVEVPTYRRDIFEVVDVDGQRMGAESPAGLTLRLPPGRTAGLEPGTRLAAEGPDGRALIRMVVIARDDPTGEVDVELLGVEGPPARVIGSLRRAGKLTVIRPAGTRTLVSWFLPWFRS